MQNETAVYYLKDLGLLIKEQALAAKARQSASEDAYDLGYRMAYYEIVSLMQSQANAFGIPLSDISLSDIEAEKDLL
tara:strand:+ start:3046 stop:3276 length:231 start_codon:yes stop_codon:yes gene_type:complete